MANIISHTSCWVSMNQLPIVYRRHILWTHSTYRSREKVYYIHNTGTIWNFGLWMPSLLSRQTTQFECPKSVSWWNILPHKSCTVDIIIQPVNRKKMTKILLTSSVLTISFAMKRRIFSGTDGFPNLPCRNFIQRGRSIGTVPWNLKERSKNQLTSWTKQAYQAKKPPARATQVSL